MAKYGLEFKMQIVREYKQGETGYKFLAKKYNLSRDTIRGFIYAYLPKEKRLETAYIPKIEEMSKIEKEDREKDFEYYKTAAIYWEEYAKLIEREIAEKNKKKLKIQAIANSVKKGKVLKARLVCKVAGIAKSTYYFNYMNNSKEIGDMEIVALIMKLPEKIRKRGGSKTKSHFIKNEFNIVINHKRITRICKEYGLLAKNRRRKHPKDYYENKKEEQRNKPKNILNREFKADRPFEKLVTDVSYFKTASGWLYFSPVMDLYNRKIICYSMSKNNDNNLVSNMLDELEKLNPNLSLLHSDQGVLYTAKEYRKRLMEKGFIQSMSRKANCWDNACMEHFFGTLKVESGYDEILKGKVLSYERTKYLIEDYVRYYNDVRIQKNLGWKTPSEFVA